MFFVCVFDLLCTFISAFVRFDCICITLPTIFGKPKPRPHGHPFCYFAPFLHNPAQVFLVLGPMEGRLSLDLARDEGRGGEGRVGAFF